MASLGSLVIELAANTAKLQGDLGRAVSIAEGTAKKFKSIFGGLVGLSGGGLFVGLAAQAIEFGDELQKGAKRAGIAASTFSELAAAAKQTDVEIGTLSKGLKNMQTAISTAIRAGVDGQSEFRELGLRLDDIRKLSPDRQLELVADALHRIIDPSDRARLGTALLGKAYLELVPLLDEGAQGISRLVEEQKKLGNTFSDEQIKRLSDADDAIKKMKASFSGLATTLTAAVAPALTSFFDSIRAGFGGGTEKENLDLLRKRRDALFRNTNVSSLNPGSYEAQALKQLDDQIRNLESRSPRQTHSRGSIGPAAIAEERRAQEAVYAERKKAAEKSANDLAKIQEEVIKNQKSLRTQTFGYLNDVTATAAEGVYDLVEKRNESFFDLKRSIEEDRSSLKNFYKSLDEETQTTFERQAAEISDFKTKLDLLVQEGLDPEIAKARLEEFKKTFDTMSVYADQAARNMQDAFADFLFDPFEDGLKGMLKGFIDILRRMIAEAAAARIFDSKSKGGLGLGDLISKGIGSIFGGARASGGPVSAGKAYVVGERRPELFVPSSSGRIIPDLAMAGGSITINNYNTFTGSGDTELRSAMPAFARQISDSTIARIRNEKRRGQVR